MARSYASKIKLPMHWTQMHHTSLVLCWILQVDEECGGVERKRWM
jgi:hypothetical protein